jgi:hypothetical protein
MVIRSNGSVVVIVRSNADAGDFYVRKRFVTAAPGQRG